MLAITLTTLLILLLTLIVVSFIAFTGRAKGGAISLGQNKTQLARIVFGGLPAGLVALIICCVWGIPLWLAACVAVTAFLSDIIGHSSEQVDTMEGYEGMAIIMTAALAITLTPFYAYFWWYHLEGWHPLVYVLLLGWTAGLADWAGYRMKSSLSFWGINWCVPNDTSWGELYRYAVALGLPLAVLLNYKLAGLLLTFFHSF